MKLLHRHGANLEAQDNSQKTLLHAAAEACNLEAVQMLLAQGLNPDVVDEMGQTPLQKALDCLLPPYPRSLKERDGYSARHGEIVRLLSDSKSRLDNNEHSRQNPLSNECWEQSQCLFDQGLDPKQLKLEVDAGLKPSSELERKAELPWIRKPYSDFSFHHEKTTNAQDGLFELE